MFSFLTLKSIVFFCKLLGIDMKADIARVVGMTGSSP